MTADNYIKELETKMDNLYLTSEQRVVYLLDVIKNQFELMQIILKSTIKDESV